MCAASFSVLLVSFSIKKSKDLFKVIFDNTFLEIQQKVYESIKNQITVYSKNRCESFIPAAQVNSLSLFGSIDVGGLWFVTHGSVHVQS